MKRRALALTHTQMGELRRAAGLLPVESRDAFLQHVGNIKHAVRAGPPGI
jgi:hypothetical protein